jgi:serine/threonine protein kinase
MSAHPVYLYSGVLLADRLSAGPLTPAQAIRYAILVAEALGWLHAEGVAWGSLHPDCIRLDRGRVTLGRGRPRLSAYTSPEELEGRPADPRSDLFSLGVLTYRLYAGYEPFAGATPLKLCDAILHSEPEPLPGAPTSLDRIVRICLRRSPDERPQRVQDLIAALKLHAFTGRANPAAVELAASPVSPRCPKCGERRLRPSRPQGLVDRLMNGGGITVWRCHRCNYRFVRVGSVVWDRAAQV